MGAINVTSVSNSSFTSSSPNLYDITLTPASGSITIAATAEAAKTAIVKVQELTSGASPTVVQTQYLTITVEAGGTTITIDSDTPYLLPEQFYSDTTTLTATNFAVKIYNAVFSS